MMSRGCRAGAAKTKLAMHTNSQQKARADRAAKDLAMDALADLLSEFNRRLQPIKTVDDATRGKFGIPIYDNVPTAAAAPTEMPSVTIDTAMPLRHEIRFSGDTSRAKPEGVRAIEIYLKIGGDATSNPDDYQYLAQDTESPDTKEFKTADAGKQAYYLFEWVNTRGERGAWRMLSATVTSELQSGETVRAAIKFT